MNSQPSLHVGRLSRNYLAMCLIAALPVMAAEQKPAASENQPSVPAPATQKSTPEKAPAQADAVTMKADPAVVVLDPVEVRGERVKLANDLPRIVAPEALNRSIETQDSFLTDSGRAELRKQKYLSFLDRSRLNRFEMPGGVFSAAKRAELADRQAQFASGMNDVSAQIQLAAASGESPAEVKELRALYRDLYMSRPR